jgi:enoyl-CoA hydratase/carnithine racemase
LALACDFRIVSENCLYSPPEQRLGQIPDRAALRGCKK